MLESVSQHKGLLSIAFGERWEVLKWTWVCVWIMEHKLDSWYRIFLPLLSCLRPVCVSKYLLMK